MTTLSGPKTKSQSVAHGNYTSTSQLPGQKFPRYFEGYSEILTVLKNVYDSTSRFLADPLTIFCGNSGKETLAAIITSPTPYTQFFQVCRCVKIVPPKCWCDPARLTLSTDRRQQLELFPS